MSIDNRQPPGFSQKMWNAAVAVANFCRQPGFVDSDEYNSRLQICGRCDSRDNGTCTVCGCYITIKAKGIAWSCPLGKWESIKNKGT